MREAARQFLRGRAISFVIYFVGGNSCFRNAIRAWPLPPRRSALLTRVSDRTGGGREEGREGGGGEREGAYDGDDDGHGDGGDEGDDENGSS